MKYALVDTEGATVDTFDSAMEARAYLRSELNGATEGDRPLDDLLILEYRGGVRSGAVLDALDFLALDPENAATMAQMRRGHTLEVALTIKQVDLKNMPPGRVIGEVQVAAVDWFGAGRRPTEARPFALARRTFLSNC